MAFRDKEHNISSIVIKRPHVTERASLGQSQGVYTFIVDSRANKAEIKKAVESLYKVIPRKVHIINVPAKRITSHGKPGVKSGFKKALVYLKSGDKIEQ